MFDVMKGLLGATAAGFFLSAGGGVASELPAYTNHAGLAVVGLPVALTSRTATLSNDCETLNAPLSVFPVLERRRLAADYVALHPEAGTGMLQVPPDIRKAVECNAASVRRSQKRAAKELCSREQSDAYCAEARAALRRYLDRQEQSGRLLAAERRLLEP